MNYIIDIPPHVAKIIQALPPDVKKGVREALRGLSGNPHLGDPLKVDLAGLWKYRVRRYRIVYEVDRRTRVIRIYAVGHRREIYDKVARQLLTH